MGIAKDDKKDCRSSHEERGLKCGRDASEPYGHGVAARLRRGDCNVVGPGGVYGVKGATALRGGG